MPDKHLCLWNCSWLGDIPESTAQTLGASYRASIPMARGCGGGHPVAAGASIPEGPEDRFIATLDTIIGEQKVEKS